MKMNVAIIIPTFFEEENIYKLIKTINKLKFKKKIFVIDDTFKPLKKLNELKRQRVTYVHRKQKSGRGSAVISGFKIALKQNFNVFVEMDADFSHNPKELKRNLKIFKKKKIDLLISSRYLKKSKIINWPISRKILSRFSNILANILLKVPVHDYTNVYRSYSKRSIKTIIKNCGKIGDCFIILSEILLRIYLKKYKIFETETVFINRKRGKSSVGIKLIFSSFMGLFKLYFIRLKFYKKNN